MQSRNFNFTRIDLNLLRVFDAVYEDRNLVRAGKRLHLSQSAVSHAITRLREGLQDELFVRTSKGMEPTAKAMAMAAPLRSALLTIQGALGVEEFDPAHAVRRFLIAANDYVTDVLLGQFCRRIAEFAPYVDLVIKPSTRLDLAEQLDVGRIDVAIGVFADIPPRYESMDLWQQDDVLVMRTGHPLSSHALDIRQLAAYPLLTVSLGGQEEGAVSGFLVERGLARQSEMYDRLALEEAFAELDLVPRMRVTVPHSLAIPALLCCSDMVSIVPRPLASSFAAAGRLQMMMLPYPAQPATLRAVWHGRHTTDPAHAWLRGEILATCGLVNSGTR